jgi:hypothetical protein
LLARPVCNGIAGSDGRLRAGNARVGVFGWRVGWPGSLGRLGSGNLCVTVPRRGVGCHVNLRRSGRR